MDKAKTSYVAPHPSQNTVTRSIPVKGIPKFETDHQKSSRKPRSKAPPPSAKGRSKKRVIEHSDEDSDTEHDAKRAKVDDVSVDGVQDEQEQTQAFRQPALVTGAKLKDYQLEGVAWMAGLFQNGISGILGTFSLLFKETRG